MALCCSEEILMDIWGENQITLKYMPREAVELLSLSIFKTQGGQALGLTLKWALLHAGCWTGWNVEVLSNLNFSVILWSFPWYASTDTFSFLSFLGQQPPLEEPYSTFFSPPWLHAVLATGQVLQVLSYLIVYNPVTCYGWQTVAARWHLQKLRYLTLFDPAKTPADVS